MQPGAPSSRRCVIEPIYNANEKDVERLRGMWASKTPEEAHGILAQPDVTVTNQGDKDMQLPKIKNLATEVRVVMSTEA